MFILHILILLFVFCYSSEPDVPGSPCRYDEYKCVSGDQCKLLSHY